MPQLRLFSYSLGGIPVVPPTGAPRTLPLTQFRCLVQLPGQMMPRDGIIDPGSPLSWFPESIWQTLRHGVDYEWLPYPGGYQPPLGMAAGWAYQFRMARMLRPLTLTDLSVQLPRAGVILQFTDGDPPGNKRLPNVLLGLWGGVLEGTKLNTTTDPTTGMVSGTLEF